MQKPGLYVACASSLLRVPSVLGQCILGARGRFGKGMERMPSRRVFKTFSNGSSRIIVLSGTSAWAACVGELGHEVVEEFLFVHTEVPDRARAFEENRRRLWLEFAACLVLWYTCQQGIQFGSGHAGSYLCVRGHSPFSLHRLSLLDLTFISTNHCSEDERAWHLDHFLALSLMYAWGRFSGFRLFVDRHGALGSGLEVQRRLCGRCWR